MQTKAAMRKYAAEQAERKAAGTEGNGFAKVLRVETALRRVAVKERKAQQAAAATQATEAWLESDAAEATPWGGGRRLSRKEDPLRKGDPTQVRVRVS